MHHVTTYGQRKKYSNMETPIPDSAGSRYVKQPVVVEAMQYAGSAAECMAVYQWVESHIGSVDPDSADIGVTIDPADGLMVIRTLEGDMKVGLGWWVIKGVEGEFYPCREDIFLKTYAPDDGSGILVLPPGLVQNLKDALWFPTSIQSQSVTVSSDPSTNLDGTPKLHVTVDHRVLVTAERLAPLMKGFGRG